MIYRHFLIFLMNFSRAKAPIRCLQELLVSGFVQNRLSCLLTFLFWSKLAILCKPDRQIKAICANDDLLCRGVRIGIRVNFHGTCLEFSCETPFLTNQKIRPLKHSNPTFCFQYLEHFLGQKLKIFALLQVLSRFVRDDWCRHLSI